MSTPVFVVVGHVNRGKSSIVSTLAADESVRIDPMPGTTRQNREYPLRLGGETLYKLVDTPGFERPRQVLAWLREHETGTGERRQTVERFVHEHRVRQEFAQECELLEPVLGGGAILYVVDGSKPPSPKYEAEMEILRWTGQPRMALINPIDEADYLDSWRPILDQYFNLVRRFDSHEAGFDDRIALLKTLRELDEAWQPSVDRAIEALLADRATGRRQSAEAIADLLVDALTLTAEKRLGEDESADPHKKPLVARYQTKLRDREARCRRELREIYLHESLEVAEPELDILAEDLFSQATWNALGLSRVQLVAAGAAGGAAVGGGIDLAVGGASILAGTLIGGALGGAMGWLTGVQLPKTRVLGLPLGGKMLRVGPMTQAAFAWVLLDRALLYHRAVSTRPHARRDAIHLEQGERQGLVAHLPGAVRGELERIFARLRKSPSGETLDAARRELAERIEEIIGESG